MKVWWTMMAMALSWGQADAAPTSAAPVRTERLARPDECDDLLAREGLKLPQLRFGGCAYDPDGQGKPLRATYWLSGADAAVVERHFRKHAHLAPLRRSCCQWDSPGGYFISARGQYFGIVMVSDESFAHSHRDWRIIGRFAVFVTTYTKEI